MMFFTGVPESVSTRQNYEDNSSKEMQAQKRLLRWEASLLECTSVSQVRKLLVVLYLLLK